MSGRPSSGQTSGPHVISYSRVDGGDFALRLYDELRAGPDGVEVWLDSRDIRPERNWDDEIDAAIRRCASLLFVMTPDSVHPASVCTDEWHLARSCKKPIVPLLLDLGAVPPMLLARRQYIDFSGDFDRAIAELRRHLRFMASPEGELQAMEDRLRDAERRFDRARSVEERVRIQPHIDELRRQMAEQRRVVNDRSESIRQVKERVVREYAPRPESEEPPTRPVGPIVVNAPPLPTDLMWYFVDRVGETRLLADCLRNEGIRVILMAGPGGMGKTAIACRLLAGLERGRLPDDAGRFEADGIVYLDATAAPPLTLATFLQCLAELLPEEAMGRLRRSFDHPDATPAGKVDGLLAELGERRVVVLLDGLEHLLEPHTLEIREQDLSEALEALLVATGHGVTLIVTTRTPPRPLMRVRPDRQMRLDLADGLESADAAELLRRLDVSGALGLRDAAADLLEEARRRTGGRPKALLTLRNILYADDEATLPGLLEDTSSLLPEQVVEALIGEAFDRLDPAAQRVMQALSVYRRPVSPGAVEYLLLPFQPGLSAEPLLRRLVDMRLVGRLDVRPHVQYFLGSTEQEFAFGRIAVGRPEDRDADPLPFTRLALLHWGATYCRLARREVQEPRGIQDLQLHLMEIDLRYRGGEFDAAARALMDIAAPYLSPWGQSRLLVDECERLDGRLTDRSLAYKVAATLAIHRIRLGELELAVPKFERALELARSLGEPLVEKAAIVNLASSLYELGQVARASRQYADALALVRRLGDRASQALPLLGLGACSSLTGDLRAAQRRYLEVLVIAGELGDLRLEATVLGNLGSVLGELGSTLQAIDTLERGLAAARRAGDLMAEGHCGSELAKVLIDQGDLDGAIERAQSAARIGDRIELPKLATDAYATLALARLLADDLDSARAAVATSCQLGADSRTHGHAILALLGVIAIRQGARQDALKAFRRADARADRLLLAETSDQPRVLDAKGMALTGLALHEADETGQRLDAAIAAFAAARERCHERGLVARVARLLDAFEPPEGRESLQRIRAVATGSDGDGRYP